MVIKGKLYTYPDNFRAQKALIAAAYSGAQLELASGFEFGKTNKENSFTDKFPFGKVPAFESSDGKTLLFESNAIAHYVADAGLRGGDDGLKQALIHQWMSFADNELLPPALTRAFSALHVLEANAETNKRADGDLKRALDTLNQKLLHTTFLVGESITLADICVACDLVLAFKYVLDKNTRSNYQNVTRWFQTVVNQPEALRVLGEIKFDEAPPSGGQHHNQHHGGRRGHGHHGGHRGGHKKEGNKENKKDDNKKEQKKKDSPAPEAPKANDEGAPALAPEKPKDPLSVLPKGSWDMDDFKRFYSNNEEEQSVPYFFEKFDKEHYSIWRCDYKYNEELTLTFMSSNLIGGMFQRLEKLRKNAFASMCLFGENNNSSISGIWVWRGHDLAFELSEDWQIDYASYDWKKLDADAEETKKMVNDYFKWIGTDDKGRKFDQGKIFK